MTLENQDFDKKLVQLNAQVRELQEQIEATEKARQDYVNGGLQRKNYLLQNSVEFTGVKLEKHNGIYFIIAEDRDFEYVMRLNKDQAASLADDLDDELGKDLSEVQAKFSIVNNMLNSMYYNGK